MRQRCGRLIALRFRKGNPLQNIHLIHAGGELKAESSVTVANVRFGSKADEVHRSNFVVAKSKSAQQSCTHGQRVRTKG